MLGNYVALQENPVSRLNPVRVAAGVAGVLLLGLTRWVSSLTGAAHHLTTSYSAKLHRPTWLHSDAEADKPGDAHPTLDPHAYVPVGGVDKVLLKPNSPGPMQFAAPPPKGDGPARLLLYAGPFPEELTAEPAEIEQGWVYGVKLEVVERFFAFAVNTGSLTDILKGVLVEYNKKVFEEKLAIADEFMGYDVTLPAAKRGTLRREVVQVVKEEGTHVPAYMYFHIEDRSEEEIAMEKEQTKKQEKTQAAKKAVAAAALNTKTCVVTDVDGTLLNTEHQLSNEGAACLKDLIARNVPVILATGKMPGPWLPTIREKVGLDGKARGNLNSAGVYMQGLSVLDAKGRSIFSRMMGGDLARTVIRFSREHKLDLLAHCDDGRVVTDKRTPNTDRLIPFQEPVPTPLGEEFEAFSVKHAHKMIFMEDDSVLLKIRKDLEAVVGGNGTVVQAIHNMLEVLPAGVNKGLGVEWALSYLKIDPKNCLALGDGDNDLEFLTWIEQQGGQAVVMENGSPRIKAAIKTIMPSNDQNGFVEAVKKYVTLEKL